MKEEQTSCQVSSFELMKKITRLARRMRRGGPENKGFPGERGPMGPMGPFEGGRPPMPPFPPREPSRPPMPPFPPQEPGRPPMPKGQPPFSRERLLVTIGDNPDGIRQKALSEKLGINQSSTSELVDKLEFSGYIVRKVDPEDRRATLLFLTELGQARALEIRQDQEDLCSGMFANLTEEEKQTLSDLLDKLLMEPQAD